MRSRFKMLTIGLMLLGICFGSTNGFAKQPRVGPDAKMLQQMRQRGIEYLRTHQNKDGSWSTPKVLGFTALAATALIENGISPDDPIIVRAIDYLLQFKQKNGGIYHPETLHRNYETSIILMALVEVNRDDKYKTEIANAQKFLKELQWDEGEGLKKDDPGYGGAGYGKHSRPDLSNTQFLLEALHKSGLSVDDPAFQKAISFVSRCQNLDSKYNKTVFASRVNDGGFYYTSAAGGSSQAGTTPTGGLRSYASMTYAGLKSFIYAGFSKDDPRVAAATQWIKKHYSLEENPGLGSQGLFYYYHVFGKTLSVLGVEKLETADGKLHDWRKELATTLQKQQHEDGSWTNQADRWYEGDPALVTSYALLALAYCDPIGSQE